MIDPDDQSDASAFDGVAYADAVADQSAERDFEQRSADDLYISTPAAPPGSRRA